MNLFHREWVNQSDVQRGTKLDAYFIPQECTTLLFVVNQKIVPRKIRKTIKIQHLEVYKNDVEMSSSSNAATPGHEDKAFILKKQGTEV